MRGTFLLLVWGGGWQGGDKPSSLFPEAAASVAVPPKPVSAVLPLLWRVGGPCGTGLQLTAVVGLGECWERLMPTGVGDARGLRVMPVGFRLPQHTPGARGALGPRDEGFPSPQLSPSTEGLCPLPRELWGERGPSSQGGSGAAAVGACSPPAPPQGCVGEGARRGQAVLDHCDSAV